MAVGAGQFQLYSKIDPTLEAGDYRFVVEQSLFGTDDSMPIDESSCTGLTGARRLRFFHVGCLKSLCTNNSRTAESFRAGC